MSARADSTLPSSWRWVSLEEIVGSDAPIIYGIIQAGPDVPDGVPYVRPTEIVDGSVDIPALKRTSAAIAKRYARATLKAGDIILAIVGTIGKLAIVPPELEGANITQSSARIRPPLSMPSEYLAAALKSPQVREQFDEMEFGVAVRRLNVAHVRALQIPVAPPAEQRRIVAKLESLQARSRRAREALDAVPPLLEKLRQSILAAAFRGDLTKEWRAKNKDVEPASELLKRIRVERRKKWEEGELAKMAAKGKSPGDGKWREKYKEPEPVDEAGLPELPEGWCWTTFETVAEVDLGRQRAPQYQTGRFTRPYLRVANIKDDRIDLSDVLDMDFDEEDYAHYHLQPGDILLSEGQSPELVGQSAIYRGGVDSLCFQKTLHRFRAYPSGPSPEFAQLVFRHYLRSGTFRAVASLTVNIAHLTLVRLKPLHFPLPRRSEQEEIVRRASAALDRVNSLEVCAASMLTGQRELERSLLSKAFRGDLVPQDPSDEPAEATLARLRGEPGAPAGESQPAPRSRKRKTA